MANYPLCPDATLDELTEAVRALIPALRRRFAPLPLFVSGHSAGGHLAVELALTDWSARGMSAAPIAGIIGLSGVYDLTPLISTSLNARLRLTEETARTASPVFRATAAGIPALFAVGGGETPAFLDQTRRMGDAWAASGGPTQVAVIDEDDHFSLLSGLMADGPLATEIAALITL
jgi:arylformamidase